MKIVYYTVTGQTRRFVEKVAWPAQEIEGSFPYQTINEPFVLVVPTYDREMTDVINDFLDYQENRHFLCGVAGSGNRNFGDLFAFTAKEISQEYHVPLLLTFEFNGTDEDVETFKKVVNALES